MSSIAKKEKEKGKEKNQTQEKNNKYEHLFQN